MLYLKNEWINVADVLHVDANSGKLKITINFWVVIVENGCGFLGHSTLKSAVSQK